MSEPQYFETWHKVKPKTAERLNDTCKRFKPASPTITQDIAVSIGSIKYEKRGGEWFRLRRQKNSEYWDGLDYFIIYGPCQPFAFIIIEMPRKLKASLFKKAAPQIWKHATGLTYNNECGIDGADKLLFERRVVGKKPEPAYRLYIDGTWKRIK